MNKLNKKGASLGMLLMIFIGVIVTLALFAGTFEPIGNMRNIRTITNEEVTTAATNATITLTGRSNTTPITVANTTGTFTNNFTVVTTNTVGALAILLKTTDAAATAGADESVMNVSYSYKPQGYNDSSGARGVIVLVTIMSALAIAVFVIPGFKDALGNVIGS